jgi:ribosomal protein S12 methylthiotransferase
MDGEVSGPLKKERLDRLMAQQQEIVFAHNRAWIGREMPVLVERKLGRSAWEGRTAGDAPEIDTLITLHPPAPGRERGMAGTAPSIGTIGKARITGFQDYDLIGDLLEK